MKSKHGEAWRALMQLHLLCSDPQPWSPSSSPSWPLGGNCHALGVRIPKKVAREYHDWKRS